VRNALEVYLIVGALTGLVVVFNNTRPMGSLVYATSLLVLILLWPLCLLGGAIKMSRKSGKA
jgi:phosphate starvation-inducible membrane PsiE